MACTSSPLFLTVLTLKAGRSQKPSYSYSNTFVELDYTMNV